MAGFIIFSISKTARSNKCRAETRQTIVCLSRGFRSTIVRQPDTNGSARMAQSPEQTTPDYRAQGWIGEIPGLSGSWRRMPDEIRYRYGGETSCQCPICLCDAAGNAWNGWFSCD